MLMGSRRLPRILRWLLALLGLFLLVAVNLFWFHADPTTAAITLLLYLVVFAAKSSLRAIISVSLVASACYSFFFLPPIYNFRVSKPENVLALLVFLATAVIAGRLAERARDEAEQARDRQRELAVLFTLSRNLLQMENVADLLQALPQRLEAASGEGAVVQFRNTQLAPAGRPAVIIPLRTANLDHGALVLDGVQLSPATVEAIAGVISIALERAQALEDVARGEAAKGGERLRALILDSITHELRTPLTSIKGAASMLLSLPSLDEAARRELVTIVDEESDRLNRLVGQAVQMAEIESNDVRMTIVPTDLTGLVEVAREHCGHVFQSHAVTVAVEGLPRVLADAAMAAKVLCHLLENAAKYSAPGSPIHVAGQVRLDQILLTVSDRGSGIDPREQGLIFDRLYRSASQRGKTPGTGMGLAISRAIVHSHGGALTVESQPGLGSTFTFSLPAAP